MVGALESEGGNEVYVFPHYPNAQRVRGFQQLFVLGLLRYPQ